MWVLNKSTLDIDVFYNGGRTPLTDALRYGDSQASTLLINKGADCSMVDHGGRIILHLASYGALFEGQQQINCEENSY